MKIVQVIYSLDLGGIEAYAANLAGHIASDGRKSHLIMLSAGRDKEWCRLKEAEIRKTDTAVMDLSGYGKLSKFYNLMRFLQRIRPDVVIIHHELNSLRVLPAKLISGFKLIQVQHNTKFNGIIRNRMTKLFVDKFVCPSEDVQDVLNEKIRVRKKKIEIIKNGINLERFSCHKDEKTHVAILAAGRFVKQKNFIELAYIFKELLSMELPVPVRIIWAGEGEMLGKVKDICGDCSEIAFAGSVPDLRPLYAESDIYVSYSLHEGLSLALLEAMASGCAVLSTATSGTKDVIRHGESGLITGIGDRESFLDALVNLIKNNELRNTWL